ncbi:hypothetical protein IWZ01DRAFT_248193 [Phyllosticta capitalensis]
MLAPAWIFHGLTTASSTSTSPSPPFIIHHLDTVIWTLKGELVCAPSHVLLLPQVVLQSNQSERILFRIKVYSAPLLPPRSFNSYTTFQCEQARYLSQAGTCPLRASTIRLPFLLSLLAPGGVSVSTSSHTSRHQLLHINRSEQARDFSRAVPAL